MSWSQGSHFFADEIDGVDGVKRWQWQVFLQLRLRQTDRWEPALLQLASDGQDGQQGHRGWFTVWLKRCGQNIAGFFVDGMEEYPRNKSIRFVFPHKLPTFFVVFVFDVLKWGYPQASRRSPFKRPPRNICEKPFGELGGLCRKGLRFLGLVVANWVTNGMWWRFSWRLRCLKI